MLIDGWMGSVGSLVGPVWSPYPPAVALPPRQMSYLAFLPYLLPSSLYAASLPQAASIRPSDQLACIDEVMAGTDRADVTPYEELGRGNGSWAGIGREMRFTRELGQEARRIVGRVFGWGENQEGKGKKVSPSDDPLSRQLALLTLFLLSFWDGQHITLHIRHGDFLSFQCQPEDSCWSIAAFHSALLKLQSTLPPSEAHIKDILVLTDETDPAFIAEARSLGWKFASDGKGGPGGEEIKKKLGGWSVPFIPFR